MKPNQRTSREDVLFILFQLLLQVVKLRGGEKLPQGDPQAVADELDGQQLRIPAFPIQDVLDAGRRQCADRGQPVDGHVMLLAKTKNAVPDRLVGFHAAPPGLFPIAYPKGLAKIGYACYYRLCVDDLEV